VWVRAVTDTMVTADLEVRHADGTVWARITGWTDRRFLTDAVVDPMLRWPEANRMAEEQPGGWFLLRDRWRDPANRELVMRRYLAAAERRTYDQQNPRGRHRWLLGRMAAKDALRQHMWDRGAGALYPAQFVIDNDDSGRPTVNGPADGVGISIAHTGTLAVALVGQTVGIDVELVEERAAQFEATACGEAERALLDDCCTGPATDQRHEWLTRFWTAKEAVAKAVGTGLGGRPQSFEIQRIDGTRLLVVAREHDVSWWVDTTVVSGDDGATRYAVGWTTTPAEPVTTGANTTRGFSPVTRSPLIREV
jgi:phosphopantetheinyl transferase